MSVSSWSHVRSRFVFQRRDVRGADAPLASATKDGVMLREDLDVSVWNPESDVSNYKLVEPDDFVIGLRSFQHGISHSKVRGIVSPAYTVIRGSSSVDPRFFKYYFRSAILISQLANLTQGIRQGQTIDIEAFANLELFVPPCGEQRRIAKFLDAETARIDQLTALQQKFRSSVEARTLAQLDFKIDELSNKFGTLPFRRMIWSVEQGVSPQCDNFAASAETWGVLKVSAIKRGTFFQDENKQLPADIQPERRYEIKSGDLLITRANTPQLVGAAAIADSPRRKLMLCDKIFRVATTGDLLPEFLVLVSLGTKIREMCAEASHGTSQSMANLKTEEIKQWPIPAVPLTVQRAVLAELSAARGYAASLVEAIDIQLALLAERRQALITAAVTGGITV